MPHTAREKSASGYYHVVPKGLADQILFDDDLDRQTYLDFFAEAKDRFCFRLHAYCLMSNHAHLIIEDSQDIFSKAMKRVDERYATYRSLRLGRKGGIFSKSLWSEPIETDAYLLCAVRYVHANPASAGICPAEDYQWSSMQQYMGKYDGIADTATVLDLLGGVQGFIEFSQQSNETALPFTGSKLKRHLTDEEYLRIALDIEGSKVLHLSSCDEATRKETVNTLSSRGFPVSVIVRLTGLGRREIESYL